MSEIINEEIKEIEDVGTEPTEKQEEEKTFTQAELDEIVKNRLARAMEKAEKERKEAEEYAQMSAKEKAEKDREKLERELAEYKRKDNLNSMIKTARGVLAENDINLSDEMLSILVTEEAESTNSNINNFVNLFNTELEKAVKEKLKSSTPKKMGSTGLTKDEILAIPDNIERQRMIAENIDLFN